MDFDTKIIGNRLRRAREAKELSQMQAELAIDASPGSLSRIENGLTNPTKETLQRLFHFYQLSSRETEYIAGSTFYPASPAEIAEARAEAKAHFERKGVLAYLLDERYRFIDVSKDFSRFLDINPELIQSALGRSFISVILDPKINILGTLNRDELKEMLSSTLERMYSEMGYMIDDQYYQEALSAIYANPLTLEIWKTITTKPPLKSAFLEKRKVSFKIGKMQISLYYSDEPLLFNRRFEFIEYTPTSKLIRLLSRIL